MKKSYFPSGLILITLIMFTLPFMEVSCGRNKVDVKGTDLVFGAKKEIIVWNDKDTMKIKPSIPVLFSFFIIIAALLFSLLDNPKNIIKPNLLLLIAIGFMIIFYINPGFGYADKKSTFNLNSDDYKYKVGYFATMFFLILSSIVTTIFSKKNTKTQNSRICPVCGKIFFGSELYCIEDGNKLITNNIYKDVRINERQC